MKKTIIKRTLTSLLTLVIILSLVTLVSCSKSSNYMAGDAGVAENNGYGGGYTSDVNGKVNTVLDEENRKIIKNVNESVQTDDFDGFLDSLNEAIGEAGGYISSSSYTGNSYNESTLRTANITIRIPADKLLNFTEKVDSMSVVTSYNEYIDDVTNQYIDVTSRITVLEAEETALLEILKTATTTSEMLDIRTRLLDVQSDLASLRAQRESIDDRVEYSTVTLRVREVRRAVPQDVDFFDEVGGNFIDSVYDIGEGLRAFAVWLLGDILYILIVSGIIAGAFFLIRSIVRKKGIKLPARKNKKVEEANKESENE